MTPFLVYCIVLAAAAYCVGLALEYIKQYVKIKQDVKTAVFRVVSVAFTVLITAFLAWNRINALPTYLNSYIGATKYLDYIVCAVIIYIGQLNASMKMIKALFKKSLKNYLIKKGMDDEEIQKMVEEL